MAEYACNYYQIQLYRLREILVETWKICQTDRRRNKPFQTIVADDRDKDISAKTVGDVEWLLAD